MTLSTITTNIMTNHKEKIYYLAPQCEVLSVQGEGVIAASDVNAGNSINNWRDGGIIDEEFYL